MAKALAKTGAVGGAIAAIAAAPVVNLAQVPSAAVTRDAWAGAAFSRSSEPGVSGLRTFRPDTWHSGCGNNSSTTNGHYYVSAVAHAYPSQWLGGVRGKFYSPSSAQVWNTALPPTHNFDNEETWLVTDKGKSASDNWVEIGWKLGYLSTIYSQNPGIFWADNRQANGGGYNAHSMFSGNPDHSHPNWKWTVSIYQKSASQNSFHTHAVMVNSSGVTEEGPFGGLSTNDPHANGHAVTAKWGIESICLDMNTWVLGGGTQHGGVPMNTSIKSQGIWHAPTHSSFGFPYNGSLLTLSYDHTHGFIDWRNLYSRLSMGQHKA
jgi:hypothetical protein